MSNKIGDAGATALGIALPGSSLQILILENNQVGDAGAAAIAIAFLDSRLQEHDEQLLLYLVCIF